MLSCIRAIRSYFDAKNKVWVTKDVDPLLKAAHIKHGSKLSKQLSLSLVGKSRSIQSRRSQLLRAHSKVSIRPLDDGRKSDVERVRIDERVTWVYTDGYDYGVESRVIQHVQEWAYSGHQWVLTKADESSEGRPLDEKMLSPQAESRDTCLPSSFAKRQTCTPYDRVKSLRYAELWWDGWNSEFAKLADDCTNFISQCLFAGGLPMQGGENRSSGWWYRLGQPANGEPWSYSWTTSHALCMQLLNKVGAVTVPDPTELKIGDVIFYDWDGSGRYHHTTIVTDFDSAGQPLVNAHTDASFHRHYLYLDSRAWTPRTRYLFVHLPDMFC